MKCSEAKAFLSQVDDRENQIVPITPVDLDYLISGGFLLRTSEEDHSKEADEVARLSQLIAEVNSEKAEAEQSAAALRQDEQREHSFTFHFEGREEKTVVGERIRDETAAVSREEDALVAMEANVNSLIQEKSRIDRMVQYDGGYVSLTGLGSVTLNDLSVRNYRVADQEFSDFLLEMKAVDDELKSIADRTAAYVSLLRSKIPKTGDPEDTEARSLLWSTAIGLAKLQGDTNLIGERFLQAFGALKDLGSSTPNKLMAAEVMTTVGNIDVNGLEANLKELDHQLRKADVPKEISAGVAATMMAGKRFDGSYPTDNFFEFKKLTPSYEAASILAVMNIPYDGLSAKFELFRSRFKAWGYMTSEDTEIASAFLAIGELGVDEVDEKLKYVIEQLKNYLEYPLVAAAILASIPVFEAHEVLDLMERAVTYLSGHAGGLERSELVALAVRMIHGVRNELVKKIDPTARITQTPVQFTYSPHPGLFIWYQPVIIAHSYYHATFSGMGGFHPAHSHGVGGFAG
ncbi:MAG TPA: hypothetical protein VEC08_03100 [Nitrososphaerales archaeon]|nr:hypothetical protein [Nitrososphaerales archaeon]